MKEAEKHLRLYKKQKEGGYYDPNMEYNERQDVKNGAWVLITRTVPVNEWARPILYGIYWGTPNEDKFGRQSCKVFTTETVVLLNHEYTVIDEKGLKEYREEGWELREIQAEKQKINLELLEKGRSLAEEEREIIMAMQLDGLTEEQACEEYFFTHHTDASNFNICYIPNEEVMKMCLAYFGER